MKASALTKLIIQNIKTYISIKYKLIKLIFPKISDKDRIFIENLIYNFQFKFLK